MATIKGKVASISRGRYIEQTNEPSPPTYPGVPRALFQTEPHVPHQRRRVRGHRQQLVACRLRALVRLDDRTTPGQLGGGRQPGHVRDRGPVRVLDRRRRDRRDPWDLAARVVAALCHIRALEHRLVRTQVPYDDLAVDAAAAEQHSLGGVERQRHDVVGGLEHHLRLDRVLEVPDRDQ